MPLPPSPVRLAAGVLAALALGVGAAGVDARDPVRDWWQAEEIRELAALRVQLDERAAHAAELAARLREVEAASRDGARRPGQRRDLEKLRRALRNNLRHVVGTHNDQAARAAELSTRVRAPWRVGASPLP